MNKENDTKDEYALSLEESIDELSKMQINGFGKIMCERFANNLSMIIYSLKKVDECGCKNKHHE